uniref:WRKY domain-containing protein n=1 Tax=Cucumis melo TaxID=3656 RepID=A0A9I9DKG1_CUCME
MEEAISLILRGCSLARQLEFNVLNLGNNNINMSDQSHFMARSCDEILGVFSAAKDRLSSHEPPPLTAVQGEVGLEEWLKSTCSQAMELAQMQTRSPSPPSAIVTVPAAVKDSGKLMAMGFSSSSSSSTKARRRKDDMEKRTVRVGAPRIGNTELPPDDGFTWRKYGQKEILGSRFPRGYFRCTHQKLYHCPAKKHVQRLDDDPHTFEVTYRGDHTCHMSATAPSAPPPPPLATGQPISQLIHPASAAWLSMDVVGSGSKSGAPCSVRYGKEVGDQFAVVDMADVMFNSGTSSSNSMDSIFAAYVAEDHKWEKEDKKN